MPKIRIRKLVKYPQDLIYAYSVGANQRYYDEELKPFTRNEYEKGIKKPKIIRFDKDTAFRDFEMTENELVILREHSQVSLGVDANGEYINKNQTNAIFQIVNIGDEQVEKVRSIKELKAVLNYVDSLSKVGMYNLCNYLQIDVKGMTVEEIYILLLKPIEGEAYKNVKKVMAIEKNPDAELEANIHKAIFMGLITKSGNEFYYSGKMVAGNMQELYYYFKNTQDLYNKGLLVAVKEKEIDLPVSVQFADTFEQGEKLFDGVQLSKQAVDEKISDAMYEWARAKSNELGMKGQHNTSREKLLPKVLEYEADKAEFQEKFGYTYVNGQIRKV